VGPGEKCHIQDFFPKSPLASAGEVLQMLWFGMHDVEMGGQGREKGILRAGRQSAAELVFGLARRFQSSNHIERLA